jgi:diguanylate cyclase (GGDEF)-like protein
MLSMNAIRPTPAPTTSPTRTARALRLRHAARNGPLDLVLGKDADMRLARGLNALASSFYLSWLAALWWVCIPTGLISAKVGEILMQQLALAIAVFYPLVRSGVTRKWSDAALLNPQMLWASAAVIMGYAAAPQLRAEALETLVLIQVFGFLYLKPAAVRWLGAATIAMLLGMLTLMVRRHSPSFNFTDEVLRIGTACVVIGLMSWQSGHFADLRDEVSRKRRALKQALDNAKQISLHDTLTGLPNRQYLQERIEAERERAARSGSHFSVALLDLDHFKQVNDTYGHHVGDEVLIAFAKAARKALRETDLLGRWGGEEFVVLMMDTAPAPVGTGALERIRVALGKVIASKHATTLRVRFSAGMACSRPGETLEQIMTRADKALYEAKSGGRNRTCVDA